MPEPHLELHSDVDRMAAVVEQETRRSGADRARVASDVAAGLRYCSACADWHTMSRFGIDSTRLEGIASQCKLARAYAKTLRQNRRFIGRGLR